MPKSLRLIFTASAFLAFFMTGGLLGRLLLPIVMALPGSPERRRARREGFFLWANRVFVGYMRALRLIYFERPPLPPDLPPSGQAYVVIANHPSLIDTLLLGATLPGLTMVAKASWYRSWLLGPLLKHGGHVRGPEPRALAEAGASDMSWETWSPDHALEDMSEGTSSLGRVRAALEALEARHPADLTLIEGAGGLWVPMPGGTWLPAWIAGLAAAPIVVGRLGLGTINHCLATIAGLRRLGLPPRGFFLAQTTPDADPSHAHNERVIAAASGLPCLGVLAHGQADAGWLRPGAWDRLLADA